MSILVALKARKVFEKSFLVPGNKAPSLDVLLVPRDSTSFLEISRPDPEVQEPFLGT